MEIHEEMGHPSKHTGKIDRLGLLRLKTTMESYEATSLVIISGIDKASFGHSCMHEPHPVHRIESITIMGFMSMACSGHISMHSPQFTQSSRSITSVIFPTLLFPSEAVSDFSVGFDEPAPVAVISAIL